MAKAKLGTTAKKKPAAKKAAPKRTIVKKVAAKKKPAAKKTAPKTAPAKKAAPRKKAIGFEVMASHKTAIEKSFETMQAKFDEIGESIAEFAYEGKKKNAAVVRAQLMDIIKGGKELRTIVQEAKTKLKPIYKD